MLMNFKTRTRTYGARSSSITVASFSDWRTDLLYIGVRHAKCFVAKTANNAAFTNSVNHDSGAWKKHQGSSGLNDPMAFKTDVGSKTHSTVMPSDWSMIVTSSIKPVTSAPFKAPLVSKRRSTTSTWYPNALRPILTRVGWSGSPPTRRNFFPSVNPSPSRENLLNRDLQTQWLKIGAPAMPTYNGRKKIIEFLTLDNWNWFVALTKGVTKYF